MSNIPSSLTDSSLNLFNLAISASDPWPFSTFFLMGIISGDNKSQYLMNFHIHIPHIHIHQHNHHHHHHHHQHGGRRDMNHIPKGCLAILVGQGEEQERFIIPVMYMNHPLFMQLLKEAEEEYGFQHTGPINIPCHVEEFRYVQGLIDKETSHNNNNHHQLYHNISWCFKA